MLLEGTDRVILNLPLTDLINSDMSYRYLIAVNADALHPFKSRGFGGEIGLKELVSLVGRFTNWFDVPLGYLYLKRLL